MDVFDCFGYLSRSALSPAQADLLVRRFGCSASGLFCAMDGCLALHFELWWCGGLGMVGFLNFAYTSTTKGVNEYLKYSSPLALVPTSAISTSRLQA